MPRSTFLAALCLLAPSVGLADEQVDEDIEIVVVDPFARWNGTRWRVDTQIGMPFPIQLYAEKNKEIQVVAVDVRAVVQCELGDALGRKNRDADCTIEDVAISAAPWLKGPKIAEIAQEVLDETDRRLTGLVVRLLVTDDGRVENITLVGEPQTNRRVNVLYENLRQVMSRAFVGFHLRSPDTFKVGRTFREKNSAVFSIPAFRTMDATIRSPLPTTSDDAYTVQSGEGGGASPSSGAPGLENINQEQPTISSIGDATDARVGAMPFVAFQAIKSYGFSVVAHRMDLYKGRYLVQSRGEGTVDLGEEIAMTFRGGLDAVSVFDRTSGIMTERVWTLRMQPTAGSSLANGVAGWPYWHQGNLRQLEADETSEVGRSAVVSAPFGEARGQLPPWPTL